MQQQLQPAALASWQLCSQRDSQVMQCPQARMSCLLTASMHMPSAADGLQCRVRCIRMRGCGCTDMASFGLYFVWHLLLGYRHTSKYKNQVEVQVSKGRVCTPPPFPLASCISSKRCNSLVFCLVCPARTNNLYRLEQK